MSQNLDSSVEISRLTDRIEVLERAVTILEKCMWPLARATIIEEVTETLAHERKVEKEAAESVYAEATGEAA